MNAMQRCILTLYTYDSMPDDISTMNVLRQSLELINKLPLIAVYSYSAYCHYRKQESLMIRNPQKGLLLAENILQMIRVDGKYTELEANISDASDESEIREYLLKILDKKAFDKSGLIYGMGHAVYTLSDPREVILKEYARKLSEEKGILDEFLFYDCVERLAGDLIMEKHKVNKNVCANVDFYSGFVYTMLGIPEELFTPIFAMARIPGWCAHRLEELLNGNKIIRPAYKYVGQHVDDY